MSRFLNRVSKTRKQSKSSWTPFRRATPSSTPSLVTIQCVGRHSSMMHAGNTFTGRVQRTLPSSVKATLFGSHSIVARGSRMQMVKNTVKFNSDLMKWAYDQFREQQERSEDSLDLTCVVDPSEFMGFPSSIERPFHYHDELGDILLGTLELFEETVPVDDRNFIYTLTLPVEIPVDVSRHTRVGEANTFISMSHGVFLGGDDVWNESRAHYIVMAKHKMSSIDVHYGNDEMNYSYNHVNAFFQLTNDGHIVMHIFDICLDHAMGAGVVDFERALVKLATEKPSAYQAFIANPRIVHHIPSSSVLRDSSNLLGGLIVHTDTQVDLRHSDSTNYMLGVYTPDSVNGIPFSPLSVSSVKADGIAVDTRITGPLTIVPGLLPRALSIVEGIEAGPNSLVNHQSSPMPVKYRGIKKEDTEEGTDKDDKPTPKF